MTRCKFHCQSVEKSWDRSKEKFVYTAKFSAVYDGSEENKKFFEYTPNGALSIGLYKEDLFVPGRDYYLDMSEAVPC